MDKTPTGRKRLIKWLGAGELACGRPHRGRCPREHAECLRRPHHHTERPELHRDPDGGPRAARSRSSDEQAVSSALEAELKAAALKAVPGGTVIRVETDAGDGEWEAHMKKADGTLVTVKFDKNKAVIGVEDGMGNGDPGHH